MKISLATFTEEQLKEYTTKVITEQNNAFCAETGEKPTIRFSTKPAAIKKCLINQKLYVEQLDKKAEELQHKITNELVTNKELNLIVNIAESEYTVLNGSEPDTVDQTVGWSFAAITTKSDGGVMSSLIKKELAWFQEDKSEPDSDTVGLTEQGFKLYKDIKSGKVVIKEVKKPKQKTTEAVTSKPAEKAKSKIILAADEPKATVVYHKLWELVSTSLDEINRKELGKVFAEEQNILETSAQWYISKAIVNGILKVKE